MDKPYFVIDIETIPLDLDNYFSLDEEDRLKLLNPIDSKIIGIGLRVNGESKIFYGDSEKDILEDFWLEWSTIIKGSPFIDIVGFSITNFDLPFITSRSFINNVTISPFLLKQIVDLRDKINAYRYGATRGKLKEYAQLIGLEILDIDGSDVAKLYREKNHEKIKEYLDKDLQITEELYKRACETNIVKINRW